MDAGGLVMPTDGNGHLALLFRKDDAVKELKKRTRPFPCPIP